MNDIDELFKKWMLLVGILGTVFVLSVCLALLKFAGVI
jgi:hypothetical protein